MTYIIGVTGIPGGGKTTLTKIWQDTFNDFVISADDLAKEVLYKEENIPALKKILGENILNPDGKTFSYRAISKIIFENEDKRKALMVFASELLWPIIRIIISNSEREVIVIENALLFETGWNMFCDFTICVWCSEETSVKRILSDPKRITFKNIEEVTRRIRVQMPIKEKVRLSDYGIDTENLSLAEFEERAKKLRHKFMFDKQNKNLK